MHVHSCGVIPQETHQWEDPPGTDLQAYDAKTAAEQLGIKPEVDYYSLLEVTQEADAATIKRQYYILARKWHPGAFPGAMCCSLSIERSSRGDTLH